MREVLCLVLGGGRGTRLYPLTKYRSKPAVPFAGKYRLVDIPISNSLNSGFNRIYVLTQFNSESLNKHISRTYHMDHFSKGFVDIMAAEQSMESVDWFQGTADAVRRTMKHFNNPQIKYVLVLSGDQFYRMDFTRLLDFHNKKNAEITIACNPVSPDNISDFGIMCVDGKNHIKKFVEKPKTQAAVKGMSVSINRGKYYLASMGIYLFNKGVLSDILHNNLKADFGREVIPDSFGSKATYAYVHDGYWNDIGTIKAFFEENLSLAAHSHEVNMFDENWHFFTRPRYLPPAKMRDCRLDRVIVGEGSVVEKCSIERSVIGVRSRIGSSATLKNTVMMGADYYEGERDLKHKAASGTPLMGIGKGSVIQNAIIDKNAAIGDGVKILNKERLKKADFGFYCIRDGIVIIPKNAVIPAGAVI